MIFTLINNFRVFWISISICAAALLSAGVAVSLGSSPVAAAYAPLADQNGVEVPLSQACTPPTDWEQTVRLESPHRSSHEWTFNVAEPEMEVTLEIFYYQDYDREGCPYDCDSGECQLDETGMADTPLGSIQVDDSQASAHAGSETLSGRLPQGDHQVVFRVTGRGSINVGFRARTNSLPTQPPPTETPEPSPTALPPTATPTGEVPLPTQTPTRTDTPPTATPTRTPSVPSPSLTPTYTASPTENPPSPTVLPPNPTPTPTPENPPSNGNPTPPPTLPPPAPPPNINQPPVLIPITGADLSHQTVSTHARGDVTLLPELLINIGITMLGISLVVIGVIRYLSRINT